MNPEIASLLRQISGLPQMSSRQSKRILSHLLDRFANGDAQTMDLITTLSEFSTKARRCPNCANVFLGHDCEFCAARTSHSTICVVESLYELWRFSEIGPEDFGYHILGGVLSASAGVAPRHLSIPSLIERIAASSVSEVIIALNRSYDSTITSDYLADILKKRFPNLLITVPAEGLPGGADFDFIDDKTIERALSGRTKV